MMLVFRLVFTFLFILGGIAHGQVITSIPEYPLPETSVLITFNAAEGNAALDGFDGDIYAHTGVITSESNSMSDWKYVKTQWDENIPAIQLTNIGNDLWQLDVSPDIRAYYDVPIDEEILQLAFVFRNADGTIVARNSDGTDIFVNVFSNPYRITWNQPDVSAIYTVGETISTDVVVLAAQALSLSINNVVVETVGSNNLVYSYQTVDEGTISMVLNVTTADSVFSDSLTLFVRGQTPIAELPSDSLVDGINYIDDETVTLVLFAPYKDFVFVKSSFNNWVIDEQNQMFLTPDSLRYWLTINNLEPGVEYAFQYIVDGEITIADPYADKILDPWNDSYISPATYPNLLPYPVGAATGILSVFQTAQVDYQWQSNSFARPNNQDLIVYELLVRDFVEERNYQTLIDTIQYLKNLGINAIELMPVSEFEGNSSWGYNPSFYFAPDKYYGTKNDLKEFIDVCHSNGIAVILDMVLNHSFGQSPLVQLYFDAAAGEYGEPTTENPWYNKRSPNPTYYWGFDFNHESTHTKQFVSRVVKYWLDEYKFDGFRFDFTKGFTNTPGEGWPYDQARIKILKAIADTIWNTAPGAYVILEHLTDNTEETVLANYGMMLWGNMNHAYNQSSMGYADGSNFSGISYKSRNWSCPHLVGYMESHDEERQMFKNLQWGNKTPVYDITVPEIALRRAELTSLFFLTIPGPKMIWQFGEMGYDYSIDFDCRVCEKPVRWDYMNQDARRHLYHFYADVIRLRNSNDVFKTSDFTIDASSDLKTISFQGSTKAYLMGNFGVKPLPVTLNLDASHSWYSYFEANATVLPDAAFVLQPGSYKLLISAEWPLSAWPAYPSASQVTVTENLHVSDTLTGSYNFFDMNGHVEGNSQYAWYRSDDSLGSNKIRIDDADQRYYVTSEDDWHKYLSFVVLPVAISTDYSMGLPGESQLVGPVEFLSADVNIYPVPAADAIKIDNIAKYSDVMLLNNAGQLIEHWVTNGVYSLMIDLNGLEPGVYFIQLRGAGDTATKKIIKIP